MTLSRALWAPLAVLALSAAGAELRAAPEPAPKLVIDNKELDFGEVIHGRKAQLKIPVRNEGGAPLELKEVKPSCGCTVATFPRAIAPGQSGEIELEFDSGERPPGYQSFRVVIYSNDASQRDQGPYCTLLNLRGEVRTLFRQVPTGAYFGEYVRGMAPALKTVRVIGMEQAQAGFTLELLSELPPYLQVKVVPWEGPGGKRGQEVQVTLDPSVPRGQVDTSLEFSTSVEIQPRLRIMVAALVNDRIAGPALVDFGGFPRGQVSQRQTLVERRDGEDGLPLARVVSPYPWLKATPIPRSPQRLSLDLEVGAEAPVGPFAGTVLLLFDDPRQRAVEVPVTGRVLSLVDPNPAALLLPQASEPGAVVATLELRVTPRAAALEPAECGLEARVAGTKVELVARGALPTEPVRLVLTTAVPGEERVVVPVLPR